MEYKYIPDWIYSEWNKMKWMKEKETKYKIQNEWMNEWSKSNSSNDITITITITTNKTKLNVYKLLECKENGVNS